ncbi:hypothetical protein [Type-D symbiont of Plautia stali]|uniref:hypothetical protein n=1 Tax=Type-D symbiont of Plautia stali TaxID=1560356 RepID=UPI00073E465E|nr:hypothetical protein [Type-D symbiont of Plautia stali]
MRDYLLEEIKLQRIDFILKKVAFGTCDFEEKEMAIHWLLELSSELMAEVRRSQSIKTGSETH